MIVQSGRGILGPLRGPDPVKTITKRNASAAALSGTCLIVIPVKYVRKVHVSLRGGHRISTRDGTCIYEFLGVRGHPKPHAHGLLPLCKHKGGRGETTEKHQGDQFHPGGNIDVTELSPGAKTILARMDTKRKKKCGKRLFPVVPMNFVDDMCEGRGLQGCIGLSANLSVE